MSYFGLLLRSCARYQETHWLQQGIIKRVTGCIICSVYWSNAFSYQARRLCHFHEMFSLLLVKFSDMTLMHPICLLTSSAPAVIQYTCLLRIIDQHVSVRVHGDQSVNSLRAHSMNSKTVRRHDICWSRLGYWRWINMLQFDLSPEELLRSNLSAEALRRTRCRMMLLHSTLLRSLALLHILRVIAKIELPET